jgi:hypothetical protein
MMNGDANLSSFKGPEFLNLEQPLHVDSGLCMSADNPMRSISSSVASSQLTARIDEQTSERASH